MNIEFYGVNDRCGPFDNEVFESVFLDQICVHELLHGLDGLTHFTGFQIKLLLTLVDICNYVFKLLGRQNLLPNSSTTHIMSAF